MGISLDEEITREEVIKVANDPELIKAVPPITTYYELRELLYNYAEKHGISPVRVENMTWSLLRLFQTEYFVAISYGMAVHVLKRAVANTSEELSDLHKIVNQWPLSINEEHTYVRVDMSNNKDLNRRRVCRALHLLDRVRKEPMHWDTFRWIADVHILVREIESNKK